MHLKWARHLFMLQKIFLLSVRSASPNRGSFSFKISKLIFWCFQYSCRGKNVIFFWKNDISDGRKPLFLNRPDTFHLRTPLLVSQNESKKPKIVSLLNYFYDTVSNYQLTIVQSIFVKEICFIILIFGAECLAVN